MKLMVIERVQGKAMELLPVRSSDIDELSAIGLECSAVNRACWYREVLQWEGNE